MAQESAPAIAGAPASHATLAGDGVGAPTARSGWLTRFVARNVDEIAADKALRLYGACLGVSYVATAAFFYLHNQYKFLTTTADAICWPLFLDCYKYHLLSPEQAIAVVALLALLSLAFSLYFLMGQARTGWALLLATFVLDGLIISQDFRFRMNEHYMLLWATFAYLFFPKKREAVRFLIVSFYFWAGRIKLNQDWLSGFELARPLWLIPATGYPAACVYVIILEMVFVWGLVQPKKWLFWAVFGQFLLFHVMSWAIVGFFYPILMFGIISIFPLCRLLPAGSRNELSDLVHLRLGRSTYGLLGLFAAMQLVPFLFPGDTSWTSQGRLFSLHMFSGRASCRVWASEKFNNQPPRTVDLFRRDLVVREQCDPLVYYNGAQRLCREMPKEDPSFADLDLHMTISKRTSPAWRPLVETTDFCSKHLQYHTFWTNDWILPVKASSVP